MGIDPKIAKGVQQGVPVVQHLSGLLGSLSDDDQSDLVEAQGRADAAKTRRQAAREADQVGEERELERSRKNTNWGGSNLAMSGSKALVRDADRLKDKQDEEDVLFQGDSEADAILSQSRSRANAVRINSDQAATRSLLSLGSTIYTRR